MTHINDVPPSDETVCEALRRLGGATARELVESLVADDFDSRDTQRAIQRCIDRGKIRLASGLRLVLATTHEPLAA